MHTAIPNHLRFELFQNTKPNIITTSDLQLIRQHIESNLLDLFHLRKQKGLSRYVSHHIKVNEHPVNYFDVLYDTKKKRFSILVKKSCAQKNEGFNKKVSQQILIQPDYKAKKMYICLVASIKSKNPKLQDQVSKEISDDGGIVFTCASAKSKKTSKTPKRPKEQRCILPYLGESAHKLFHSTKNLSETKKITDICSYMIQLGAQISHYHTKKRKSHFDIKTLNVLTKLIQIDEYNTVRQFTLIDYPSLPPKYEDELNINPHNTFTYEQLINKIDIGWGETSPIIAPPPSMQGWGESHHLLDYINIENTKLRKQIIEISLTHYGKPSHAFHGHACDSYGYLYSLYTIVKDQPNLNMLFKPFISEVMTKVLEASLHNTNEWPQNLTCSGIRKSFIEFCKGHPTLNPIERRLRKKLKAIPPQEKEYDMLSFAKKNQSYYLPYFSRSLQQDIQEGFQVSLLFHILELIINFFTNKETLTQSKENIVSFMQQYDDIFTRSDTLKISKEIKSTLKKALHSIQNIHSGFSKHAGKGVTALNIVEEKIQETIEKKYKP